MSGCGCSKGPSGNYKFSGLTISGAGTTYLADTGIDTLGGASANLYPVAESIRVTSLAANLQSTVPGGASLTVNLYKNGTVVASIPYAVGEGLQKRIKFPPIDFTAGSDTFDVAVVTTGDVSSFEISAAVGYKTRG